VLALLVPGALHPAGTDVRGRVTILEKGNKPSSDLANAVVYLEGGEPAPPVAQTLEIAISDKEFVPRVTVVPQGATVQFPNHDPFEHNVFSVTEPNQFDLGRYGRGETKGHTFANPGLVRVFCNVHPRMVAFVLVMDTRYVTQPAADGSFAIAGVAPGRYTLHVWHERSPEVTRELTVGAKGDSDLNVELDARGFRWVPHKNKYGKDYPTNAGRERY
jgi:plastocyanin